MRRFDSHINGTACIVQVNHCTIVKPWSGAIGLCPSDLDFYGYTDIDFNVFDKDGNEIPLGSISEFDIERLENLIIEDEMMEEDTWPY